MKKKPEYVLFIKTDKNILVSNDILPNVVSADIHFYSEPDEKGERVAYQNKPGDMHLPLEVVLKF